jgi:hypothetical protein
MNEYETLIFINMLARVAWKSGINPKNLTIPEPMYKKLLDETKNTEIKQIGAFDLGILNLSVGNEIRIS